jgi:hypothetical protein
LAPAFISLAVQYTEGGKEREKEEEERFFEKKLYPLSLEPFFLLERQLWH